MLRRSYECSWLGILPRHLYYLAGSQRRRSLVHQSQFRHLSRAKALAGRSRTSDVLETFKDTYSYPSSNPSIAAALDVPHGSLVTLSGFIGKIKSLGKDLAFTNLSKNGEEVQIVSSPTESGVAHEELQKIKPQSAVYITGITKPSLSKKKTLAVELSLRKIVCAGSFPTDIIMSKNANFPFRQRHLQIRFDNRLRRALEFRSRVLLGCRLSLPDFQEIETPLLFKSTPEGAREFLVPTRTKGYAYALPQSPQQYKQTLMASGVNRYFQLAKCFRDEDLRADRQPEFTQLDLEMAFCSGADVMVRMERFIRDLYEYLGLAGLLPTAPFVKMTYQEAMEKHGSDKPDLRMKDLIYNLNEFAPSGLSGMLTHIHNPAIEGFKIRLDCNAERVRTFIGTLLDSSACEEFRNNADGAPGVFIYDPRKPMEGLQAFGFEGVDGLNDFFTNTIQARKENPKSSSSVDDIEPFVEGDLLILQARPRQRFTGGSTSIGRLRNLIYRTAWNEGLLEIDAAQHWTWITHFPLFSPTIVGATDPGQGGSAGFSSTHHPFTAPMSAKDVDLLCVDPLAVEADHYDLVLNGVELGGGSRRIHNSEMQQYVMKDILKMSEERLRDFSHLFEILRAGCPPHAGIALGLDRLIAMMLSEESVRDVIAFPKNNKGQDLLMESPSPVSEQQLRTYSWDLSSNTT